jgi:glutamine synthetase
VSNWSGLARVVGMTDHVSGASHRDTHRDTHLFDEAKRAVEHHGIHTVEVGVSDTYGHLRGKRVPAARFFKSVAHGGLNIADAIYVFDVQCDIVDAPTINMGTGYLDTHLTPDLSTFRLLPHRPGYAIVLSHSSDEHGQAHPLDPRAVLAKQVERTTRLGVDPIVATELECYVCLPDWTLYQPYVQYSSLTDALALESIVFAMRTALLGAGIPVESSNAEYGPGQLEINFSPADPMTTADNTVLFKSIVKQVAVQHGVRVTFMPKPWSGESGSGMHIHSSLSVDDINLFGETMPGSGQPNERMSQWTAGLLANATAMQLIGIPTPNGYRRVRPYSFCPTHIHWGADNRTVMARLTMNAGNANRVEFRNPGADANPYLAIAAVLAAGCDGIERSLTLPPMSIGDMYTEPGDNEALPATLDEAIIAFRGSSIANALGSTFSENYLVLAENEQRLAKENPSGEADEITASERQRYIEHT